VSAKQTFSNKMDIEFLGFLQLRKLAIENNNGSIGKKVAFCVEWFKKLHSDALPSDLDKNLGGRMAGILKQANYDDIRVLQAIWVTSALGIQGSHLNYIQKYLSGRQTEKKIDTTDRDKFKQGKYSHMVRG